MKRLALAVAAIAASVAHAQPEGIRGACGIFIERSTGETVRLIDQSNWTVIDNKDGTWSVGGRHTRNGRDAYTNCIISTDGKNFTLVKLTRLR